MDHEAVVIKGYSRRLASREAVIGDEAGELCSAEAYNPKLLGNVPEEIINNDFGCGNPSKYARSGDVVLDLGSGSGKICYLLSQIVGKEGRIVGVDMHRDMVALARKHQSTFAKMVGFDNMAFRLAHIQDLRTDLEKIGEFVERDPVNGLDRFLALQEQIRCASSEQPVVADESIDLIVSNCVINLVRTEDKGEVFEEMYRVLRPGGRIAVSDNVSSRRIPDALRDDPELWAGCYAGVLQEQEFYRALLDAGFVALRVEIRRDLSDRPVEGVHFRSVTVTAVKPHRETGCSVAETHPRQILYRGPWSVVTDERGNSFHRGELVNVSPAAWSSLSNDAYERDLFFVSEAGDERTTQADCRPTG